MTNILCFRLGDVGVLPVWVGRVGGDREPGVLPAAAAAAAARPQGGRSAPSQETLRHQHVNQPLDTVEEPV